MDQDRQDDAAAGQPAAGDRDAAARPVPRTAALSLGALGVVYGDIGTSPIYAFREAMRATAGDRPPSEPEVLGVLSIIVWSLTLIVAVKYALILLRADNRGEGGTLSLMALTREKAGGAAPAIVLLGMAGAGLFYGDAIITPAMSVLSAVEGVEVVAPALGSWVVPVTLGILVALFAAQRFGTAKVARVFGPITAVWFLTIGGIGLHHVMENPAVLAALNPAHGVFFLLEHGQVAFAVIGLAFLAVTGAEALYVDLGHFGRRPILIAWFCLVFPALLLSYLGQGAFVLAGESAVGQPFFQSAPQWAALPLVVLAMTATVIAGQAVITGTYSLTRQAIQLGLLPRLDVRHTSAEQSGQIYMPQVNWLLLAGAALLVLEFGSSGALASAYGIAVSGTMVVTAVLLFFAVWQVWKRPFWLAGAIVLPFLTLEMCFLAANALKIPSGGWVSVMVAAAMLLVMRTWRRGSRILFEKTRRNEVPLADLVAALAARPPHLVEGTAVFLSGDPESTPTALLHSLKHYHVLHGHNVILTIVTAERPRVALAERVRMEAMNPLFTRMTLTFGFMEHPNVPRAMALCRKKGLKFDIMTTSFFLSRRTLVPSATSGIRAWQDRLFIVMAGNATAASAYFRIPTGRAVEIGTQIVI